MQSSKLNPDSHRFLYGLFSLRIWVEGGDYEILANFFSWPSGNIQEPGHARKLVKVESPDIFLANVSSLILFRYVQETQEAFYLGTLDLHSSPRVQILSPRVQISISPHLDFLHRVLFTEFSPHLENISPHLEIFSPQIDFFNVYVIHTSSCS